MGRAAGILGVFLSCCALAGTPVVREEVTVQVDGTTEVWRLVWRTPPKPVCDATDAGWFTCPCVGFAFGEGGDLDLLRFRAGKEIDRLHLTPLFGGDDFPTTEKIAILQRWETKREDIDVREFPKLRGLVEQRPPVKIMQLADYNHDGDKSEFFLQTGVLPCGKRVGVVIGLSKRVRRLHAFGSLLHPEQPLHLFKPQWEALLKSAGPVTVKDWLCADHGSETETEMELSVVRQRIRAVRRTFGCTDTGRGRLREREEL